MYVHSGTVNTVCVSHCRGTGVCTVLWVWDNKSRCTRMTWDRSFTMDKKTLRTVCLALVLLGTVMFYFEKCVFNSLLPDFHNF